MCATNSEGVKAYQLLGRENPPGTMGGGLEIGHGYGSMIDRSIGRVKGCLGYASETTAALLPTPKRC